MSLELTTSPEVVTSKMTILRDRAHLLAQSRQFFAERQVLEVDCPMMTRYASVDAHIDLIPALYAKKDTCFLHSSPEYGMKRLLSSGIGDIYQLSHVFRDEECSPKHNPEFTMTEWYRIGFSFVEMVEETFDYIRLFLGDLPSEQISYREAFQKYAGIDYLSSSENDLLDYLKKQEISVYPGLEEEGKDAILNLILGIIIEPQLGDERLLALTFYPSSQAALAKTTWRDDEQVSERFEVYYKGIELANGYHELANAKEQRNRLEDANLHRLRLQKEQLPIDEFFLSALQKGIPDCCGVAVGFDRLMMLRHKIKNIQEVIPFGWSES